MRVAFYTFGCKVNQYESQVLARYFAQGGDTVVEMGEEADAIVVNSCTVTAEGDRKTRQLLRRVRREHPQAALVLSGCYPQAFPQEASALDADVVVGSKDREALRRALMEHLACGHKVVQIPPHRAGERFEEMELPTFSHRTRAFVKIQDGCENFCTYCIIPTARGPVRSKSPAQLEEELHRLAQGGYQEVVLSGINLSAYGREQNLSLMDAIAIAAGVPGIHRIRLGSLEPETLTPEELARLAALGKVCPQFHLSLQSGCDRTLRRMGRRYTTQGYREMARVLRDSFQHCALTTDLMVGFPGETREDHEESMAFAREMGFSKIHVFAYSQRPGTPAARMADQVTSQDKKLRSVQMMALGEELRAAFLQSMVGTIQPIILEERGEGGLLGYAPNYTPVTLPVDRTRRGELVRAAITGVAGDGCVGIPLEP